mmetsp:Transcript_71254/g.195233  ORF Transcript_71254/g.195233 Transcript_71254/m.195233 type:complete len:294 (+) Transcript_71254:878-1759(+)
MTFCGKNFNLFSVSRLTAAEGANAAASAGGGGRRGADDQRTRRAGHALVAPPPPQLFVERWVLGPPGGNVVRRQPASTAGRRLVGEAARGGPPPARRRRAEQPVGTGRRLHQVYPLLDPGDTGQWDVGPPHHTREPADVPGLAQPRLGSVHGGACCLYVAADGGLGTPAALIGVSHSKDANYQYLQQFYAFRPEPPFELLALSRPFCWRGGARTRSTLLVYRNATQPCPYIQMTMSIAQTHDDPEGVLFAVGMNDCEAEIVSMPRRQLLTSVFLSATAEPARRDAGRRGGASR